MFVDDNYSRVEVSFEKLCELVSYTKKRRELAKKVLKNPTDDNLREYNYIVEIHGELRRNLGIYPELSEEEKAASNIWRYRKDEIEWY